MGVNRVSFVALSSPSLPRGRGRILSRTHTLNQSRGVLSDVSQEHAASTKAKEAIERRVVGVGGDAGSEIDNASIASSQEAHLVPGDVLDEEPIDPGRISQISLLSRGCVSSFGG